MLKFIPVLLALSISFPAYSSKLKGEKETFTASPIPELLQVLKDNTNEFSFLLESSNETVFIIRPAKFKIQNGKTYFIDNTSESPHIEVKAETDGKLKFILPKMERAGITVSEVKTGNLLFNGSFEEPDGWTFKSKDVPKSVTTYEGDVKKKSPPLSEKQQNIDRFEFSGKFSHRGKYSLMLEKNSQDTFLNCNSIPIPVEAGKKYYLTAFYYPELFVIDTAFSLNARLLVDGKSAVHISDRHWISFPPFYTNPGQWRYTFNTLEVSPEYQGKKLEVVLSLEIDGSPGRIYWDDIDFRPCPILAQHPGQEVDTPPVISSLDLDKKLDLMKNSEAKVIQWHQRPVLEIDGRTEPCYIFHSTMDGLAYKAVSTSREQGIKVVAVDACINYWGNVKTSVWKGKNQYDFSIIEDKIKKILSIYPEAKIILTLGGIYNNFADDYPESAWITGEGKRNIKIDSLPIKKTSHISESVRKELGKTYRLIGEFLGKNPIGKVVIGIHITFGDDGQWYPDRPWSFKTFDYSEGSRQGMIAELKKMYNNNIGVLRSAWQNSSLRFEDIKMPSPGELSPEKYFLSPENGQEKRLLDCVMAYHRAVVKTINIIAGEFKKGIGKPVVAFTYFPDNCILTQGELLKSPDIDGIVALPGYMRKRNIGSHNQSDHAHGSFRLHGKIYMDEVDFRSTYGAVKDRFYRRYVGMADGLEGHFNQMRRNFAFLYSLGEWGWLRTIGLKGHFVWHGIHAPILGEIRRAAEMSLNPPVENDWEQVAIFKDDLAQTYYSFFERRDHLLNHATLLIRGLFYSGLTWNVYLLSDLKNPLRPAAKINIFSTATTISDEQIKWVEKNMQKDGNVLIFAGDAGRLASGGFEKNIKRLTGINIKVYPEITVPYSYSSERFDDPLSTGHPSNSLWNRSLTGPLFLIDDPQSVTLAALASTRLPGIAIKRHKDWTGIYVAGSCEQALSNEFLRRLAEEAKVKPIGPAGDITYAGNGFLAIHAATSGEKTLNLKGSADLLDITTNKTVAENVKSYTLKMKFGETRWFRVKYR